MCVWGTRLPDGNRVWLHHHSRQTTVCTWEKGWDGKRDVKNQSFKVSALLHNGIEYARDCRNDHSALQWQTVCMSHLSSPHANVHCNCCVFLPKANRLLHRNLMPRKTITIGFSFPLCWPKRRNELVHTKRWYSSLLQVVRDRLFLIKLYVNMFRSKKCTWVFQLVNKSRELDGLPPAEQHVTTQKHGH